MAAGYSRQSVFIDGDIILAEHGNAEFNRLVTVFNESVGHSHDGTVGGGAPVPCLKDLTQQQDFSLSTTGVTGSIIKDEDDMVSDSNEHLATQQSIKAYQDSRFQDLLTLNNTWDGQNTYYDTPGGNTKISMATGSGLISPFIEWDNVTFNYRIRMQADGDFEFYNGSTQATLSQTGDLNVVGDLSEDGNTLTATYDKKVATIVSAGTDIDTLLTDGLYRWGGATPINGVGTYQILEVRNDSSQVIQKSWGGSTVDNMSMYIRRRNAGVWTTWTETAGLQSTNQWSGVNTFDNNIVLKDTKILNLGTDSDFEMFNDGLNTYMDVNNGQNLYIRDGNSANDIRFVFDIDNGVFYSDRNIRIGDFNTPNEQIRLHANDSRKGLLNVGTADLGYSGIQVGSDGEEKWNFMADGATLSLFNDTTEQHHIFCNTNADVQLYYNGAKKLNTNNTGIDVIGDVQLTDNNHYYVGNANDAAFYHNGVNTYIINTAGKLLLQNEAGEGGDVAIQCHDHLGVNHNVVKAVSGPASTSAQLFHDNNLKLETSAGGVSVTGQVAATSLSGNLNASNVTGLLSTDQIPVSTSSGFGGFKHTFSAGVLNLITT